MAPRIILRPFSATDADEAFFAITPNLTRFMSFDPPPSRAAFDAIWQAWLPATFCIRHRDSGRFLGLAGLHDTQSAEPELGIWISESEHGHGYGREVVKTVARWATAALKPSSFRYPVAEQNLSSRRIAEALGGQVVDRETHPKYASVIYRVPPVASD
jgi:RimJ/RimL family protein N-acetyltransferase